MSDSVELLREANTYLGRIIARLAQVDPPSELTAHGIAQNINVVRQRLESQRSVDPDEVKAIAGGYALIDKMLEQKKAPTALEALGVIEPLIACLEYLSDQRTDERGALEKVAILARNAVHTSGGVQAALLGLVKQALDELDQAPSAS